MVIMEVQVKRWHQDYRHARREWAAHRRSHVESNKNRRIGYGKYDTPPGTDPNKVDCTCDEQVGRFRKKHAFDCGNVRCYTCHGDKYPVRSKHEHELRSEVSFREQLKEM